MTPNQTQIADNLLRELSDRGQIVEGGWKAMEILSLSGHSELQRSEMRKAFFFGAQHVFASMLNMMDDGREPTEQDLKRMTLLQDELEKFTIEMKMP